MKYSEYERCELHALRFDLMEILYLLLQKWIPHHKLSKIDVQQHIFSLVLVDLL